MSTNLNSLFSSFESETTFKTCHDQKNKICENVNVNGMVFKDWIMSRISFKKHDKEKNPKNKSLVSSTCDLGFKCIVEKWNSRFPSLKIETQSDVCGFLQEIVDAQLTQNQHNVEKSVVCNYLKLYDYLMKTEVLAKFVLENSEHFFLFTELCRNFKRSVLDLDFEKTNMEEVLLHWFRALVFKTWLVKYSGAGLFAKTSQPPLENVVSVVEETFEFFHNS